MTRLRGGCGAMAEGPVVAPLCRKERACNMVLQSAPLDAGPPFRRAQFARLAFAPLKFGARAGLTDMTEFWVKVRESAYEKDQRRCPTRHRKSEPPDLMAFAEPRQYQMRLTGSSPENRARRLGPPARNARRSPVRGGVDDLARKSNTERTLRLISPSNPLLWPLTDKDRARHLTKVKRMAAPGRAANAASQGLGLHHAGAETDLLKVRQDLRGAHEARPEAGGFARCHRPGASPRCAAPVSRRKAARDPRLAHRQSRSGGASPKQAAADVTASKKDRCEMSKLTGVGCHPCASLQT